MSSYADKLRARRATLDAKPREPVAPPLPPRKAVDWRDVAALDAGRETEAESPELKTLARFVSNSLYGQYGGVVDFQTVFGGDVPVYTITLCINGRTCVVTVMDEF